ncbi:MAG: hypothetical protein AAFR52_11145 [Pseudomonadota bacterium]
MEMINRRQALYLGLGGTVLATGLVGGVAIANAETIQKLAALHRMEVLLERMMKDACLVDMGIDTADAAAQLVSARAQFDENMNTMMVLVAKLDSKNPRVKRLQSEIGRKRGKWQLFERQVQKALILAEDPAAPKADITAMRLQKTGLIKAIDSAYKLVKRDLAKSGAATMGELMAEHQHFGDLFLAERLVEETCAVAYLDSDEARQRLAMTLMSFTTQLDRHADNPLVHAAVKKLDPVWRAELPAIAEVVKGGQLGDEALARLAVLSRDWALAVDDAAVSN